MLEKIHLEISPFGQVRRKVSTFFRVFLLCMNLFQHKSWRSYVFSPTCFQARRQLNWNGGGGMDSQYKLLSELLSDQAAFITSPKTSLANYWGGGIAPLPPQCLRACLF